MFFFFHCKNLASEAINSAPPQDYGVHAWNAAELGGVQALCLETDDKLDRKIFNHLTELYIPALPKMTPKTVKYNILHFDILVSLKKKRKEKCRSFPPPVCYQATFMLVCQQQADIPGGREQMIHYSAGSESSHRNSSSHTRGHPHALDQRWLHPATLSDQELVHWQCMCNNFLVREGARQRLCRHSDHIFSTLTSASCCADKDLQ